MDTTPKEQVIKNVQRNHDQNLIATPDLPQESLAQQNLNEEIELYPYGNLLATTYADNNYAITGTVPLYVRNQSGWDPTWSIYYKRYVYKPPEEPVSDCTNFVSQAVFEGVSYTSSDLNYFYPDSYNHYYDWWYYKFSPTGGKYDGSYVWIRVGELYEFLTENYFNYTNFGIAIRGPAGQGLTNTCNIHMGDLIFMSDSVTGEWRHSVIVDQLGQNPCLDQDVYVAAHDEDVRFTKLSNYTGYLLYPVHIVGYFKGYQKYLPVAMKFSGGSAGKMSSNPYPSPENDTQPSATILFPYPNP